MTGPTGSRNGRKSPGAKRRDRSPPSRKASDESSISSETLGDSDKPTDNQIHDRFLELASDWKRETRFFSNITKKSMHVAYQKIIGMGKVAIPFILQDLKKNGPNDWFWALYVITDVNPITEEIAGDMRAMTEAWLAWGKKAGYLRGSQRKTKAASRT